MKTAKRIIIVSAILLGGAGIFGYWSFNQFNIVTDQILATALQSNVLKNSISTNSDYSHADISTTTSDLVLTDEISSSTPDYIQVATSSFSVSTDNSSTSASIQNPTLTPTSISMDIVFPSQNSILYQSCSYTVSWQSSTTVSNLSIDLIDGGTKKKVGPGTSGLSRMTVVDSNQNFSWKVGTAWPGSYFINISKINDIEVNIKSYYFTIKAMPNKEEKGSLCEKTGGILN